MGGWTISFEKKIEKLKSEYYCITKSQFGNRENPYFSFIFMSIWVYWAVTFFGIKKITLVHLDIGLLNYDLI